MRRVPAIVAVLTASLVCAKAGAYCRSSACAERVDGSTDGHVCVPAQLDDCGVPLQWRQPCIGFNLHAKASIWLSYEVVDAALVEAFSAWTAVACEPGTPSLQVFDLGPVECARVEYNQHAGNANVVVFRDDVWPHASDNGLGTTDTIALATVTYDVKKGDIFDADIEINTANNTFSTSDTPGPHDVDLLGVLTHEVGHFLGLGHSWQQGTTMFPNYTKGTTDIRHPAPDDYAGICAAYPPSRQPTGECTGIPRHGFASECGADQTHVKCSAGAGEASSGGALGFAALAALALTARAPTRSGCDGTRARERRR